MTNHKLNILEDAEAPVANAGDLRQAVVYAEEMRSIEARKYHLNNELAKLDERYAQLQLELLPDLLMAIGMKKFTLASGELIEIKDFTRGSIPTLTAIEKAEDVDKQVLMVRREQAIAWLKANNAETIIKNQIVVLFGKGQAQEAEQLYTKLQEQGMVTRKEEEINFMTLNALLKAKLAEGVNIPAEPFQLFVGKKAELKAPKKGK